MKAVVSYELADVSMDRVREVYPRHKSRVDAFAALGKVVAIGSFSDPRDGSMGIFKDRASAEEFVEADPFVLEGVVGWTTIRDWNEILLK